MTQSIDLWILDSSDIELADVEKSYASHLSAAERKRLAGYSLERSKKQLLLSRAFMRYVLAFYVEIDDYDFALGAYGRPQLVSKNTGEETPNKAPPSQPELSFNLSHSRERFVIALSRAGVIGVDVEYSARRRRVERLMTRYFSPAEQAALIALPEQQRQERFYALWTLKESYIKARGMGLALPLADFSFAFSPQSQQISIAFDGSLAGQSAAPWRFWRSSAAGENYALALALDLQGEGEVKIRARQALDPRRLSGWTDFRSLS